MKILIVDEILVNTFADLVENTKVFLKQKYGHFRKIVQSNELLSLWQNLYRLVPAITEHTCQLCSMT